jgi:DNA-binding MarR family transcriptional regulator
MNGMNPVATASNPVPPVVKPQGCTNLKLRQLMRRVAQHYDNEVGKSGLKGTQYSLLSYVVKLGPIRAVDLAAEMKVSTSTLSRNLQPLVAAGWLAVGPGADARSHLISATEAGQTKRAEAQRRWRVAQEGINQALGVERVAALHSLLDEAMVCLSPVVGDDELRA